MSYNRVTDVFCSLNVNVNVNKQYLSTCKSCNKDYNGCAMRVVFSKLQNCSGFSTTVTLGMAVVHSNIWDQCCFCKFSHCLVKEISTEELIIHYA